MVPPLQAAKKLQDLLLTRSEVATRVTTDLHKLGVIDLEINRRVMQMAPTWDQDSELSSSWCSVHDYTDAPWGCYAWPDATPVLIKTEVQPKAIVVGNISNLQSDEDFKTRFVNKFGAVQHFEMRQCPGAGFKEAYMQVHPMVRERVKRGLANWAVYDDEARTQRRQYLFRDATHATDPALPICSDSAVTSGTGRPADGGTKCGSTDLQ